MTGFADVICTHVCGSACMKSTLFFFSERKHCFLFLKGPSSASSSCAPSIAAIAAGSSEKAWELCTMAAAPAKWGRHLRRAMCGSMRAFPSSSRNRRLLKDLLVWYRASTDLKRMKAFVVGGHIQHVVKKGLWPPSCLPSATVGPYDLWREKKGKTDK